MKTVAALMLGAALCGCVSEKHGTWRTDEPHIAYSIRGQEVPGQTIKELIDGTDRFNKRIVQNRGIFTDEVFQADLVQQKAPPSWWHSFWPFGE